MSPFANITENMRRNLAHDTGSDNAERLEASRPAVVTILHSAGGSHA